MRRRLVMAAVASAALLGVAGLSWLATAAHAQSQVPPPYAGVKNPFPWDNPAARDAGKRVYQQSCTGCHGAAGSALPAADFSQAGFHQRLETEPDYFFWVVSEGRPAQGMPAFRSSLSEPQRWQVLTYLWSLSSPAAPGAETPHPGDVFIALTAPQEGTAGQPIVLKAVLRGKDGQPIVGAAVDFAARLYFFTDGSIPMGEAVTDETGVAALTYTPRFSGDVLMAARYETVESTVRVNVAEAEQPFYHPEAGIQLPALGKEVFIGPESARTLGPLGFAPGVSFRLPGGALSWLLIVAAAVALVWATYFRVLYQVLRIPIGSQMGDTDTRLVPAIALAVVIIVGAFLVLKLLTGSYSHFNLGH